MATIDFDSEKGGNGQPGGVQSVDRALQILEILSRDGHAGVSEIAEEIGIHKSSVSRLLGSLVSREMVHQNSDRGKYQLGFGILRLASSIPGRLSLVREARPVLESLAEEFKETVNLAVLRSNYAVNVDQAMGPSSLATYDWVGGLTPLHATSSGKVLLAALSADERDRILTEAGFHARTPRTITNREDLEKQLIDVAHDGYAETREELEIGLNAIAVPIYNHLGTVIGAVSISGPAFRFDPQKIPGLIDALRQAGIRISVQMGYTHR
ncbi:MULTISPECIES: IclR family transcriptional regulator [Arthrobacter]|jgi:DNA-binding IclR family transcriptional regulator|uniref:Glycerol operon regulatory protein n=1 Tax=Arthrobacter bambusae TaxID=1338426 RepID=A0AAW8D6B6_9MICC|nr:MULTISPECIES: IclR family transcriptional regulator [Arthrobacter]MDP9904451.1 DNA-binding IclR family transcriptional regulator [Arthrobacter bambusae]MDQ0127553.1 DNA-binding IclR family transcriptional regulator [Arthrobacter bambusae]MDQ0178896.1 DNA-binding IclR family transcriptional regulator [Arthrobacter bambusae]